jgi:predicted PolB exonuclease-like 3'-5' exonuclease
MIAFDIETIPNMAMVDCLPEPKIDSRLKDPAKIEAAKIDGKKEQIDDMAKSPLFGRICAFSWFGPESSGYKVMREVSEAEEILLVQEALEYFTITTTTAPAIITWNGHGFDIPFLIKRAILLSVDRPVGFPGLSYFTRRYSHVPHCDMMQELSGWDKKMCSLDVAARTFLGEKKLDHDFSKFISQIEAGEQDQIGAYCMKDSELTYRIYEKASPYLW